MLNSTVISCVAHRTTRIVPAHPHTHGRTRICTEHRSTCRMSSIYSLATVR